MFVAAARVEAIKILGRVDSFHFFPLLFSSLFFLGLVFSGFFFFFHFALKEKRREEGGGKNEIRRIG